MITIIMVTFRALLSFRKTIILAWNKIQAVVVLKYTIYIFYANQFLNAQVGIITPRHRTPLPLQGRLGAAGPVVSR